MGDNHAEFHSTNGKRRLLVVEDESINRALLQEILKEQYEVVFALDGVEAMQKLREQKDFISLVLLDLIMPNMSGQEVLEQIRASSEYQDIPVIVASGDQTQEIKCLHSGASDFIPKPYPEAGIILARIRRAIELFENRKTIESTERDPLTGLLNREFFYSYAEQYDQHHKDAAMDAIVLDINHFSTLNERYGKAYADIILRRIGEKAKDMVRDAGGIVCRREADIFQIYCPHRDDYKAILDNVSTGLTEEQGGLNRIRVRMGVYSNVDRSLDIERRFDRAKMASDTVRHNLTRSIAVYDDTLHKAELYSEKLVDDFQTAIDAKQFKVFFQPKFDITTDSPRLTGAEALVRWDHPELGRISPGVFIPLFEQNGLIQALDHYVWRETARQIRLWKEQIGYTVPVSVNVSRIDMYNPDLVDTLQAILAENQLEAAELHLEVTETAYAEDAEQIIEMVKRLRSIGFRIEMDDFGTGYSSLNMLSTLPIDVLKLDMKFIQTAFAREKDTHMLSVIVEIARHISAPVVAEGVETREQLNALKEVGCDMAQGYFFSSPIPANEFDDFLKKGKEAVERDHSTDEPQGEQSQGKRNLLNAISEWWSQHISIPMRTASVVFVLAAFLVATALYIADATVTHSYLDMERASERYILAEQSATNLEMGSEYLTDRVRGFAVTGDIQYLNDYFEEVEVSRRRDEAVSNLELLMGDESSAAYGHLSKALSLSNELMELEYRSMKYVLMSGAYDSAQIPEVVHSMELSREEEAYSPEELHARAVEMVYGEDYKAYKAQIMAESSLCTQELIEASNLERSKSSDRMNVLLGVQTALTILMLLIVLFIILFITVWIRKPLTNMVALMKARETVPPSGAEELRFVSETYNSIFEENRRTHERLTYGNMHDALTGLYNRSAYDFMKNDLDMSHNALLLVDVDKFKTINDTYGHDVGDLVLKRVAEVLKYSFRSTDPVFRIGGDEFVVIMSNVSSAMREQVKTKIEQANVMLQKPKDDLPPTSLSVGVAFGDRDNPEGDIFKDADTALYRVKEAGRCGCVIF
ncbi:MAG: EAL domain-containing protein [Clostridia bacterium]|nr:EAL domain-containing protein [Clostridia bacterium]